MREFTITFIDDHLEHVMQWYVDAHLPLPTIPRKGDECLFLGRSYDVTATVWRDREHVDIYVKRVKRGNDEPD